MRLLPRIVFVNGDEKGKEYLQLGWKETSDGEWKVRKDGVYEVSNDTVYVWTQIDSGPKLRALVHELIHAFSFRLPFYLIRELINWMNDNWFTRTPVGTWTEYKNVYYVWRDNYGRFPWIFGIAKWPEKEKA